MAAASFAAWTGSKHLAAVGKRYWDQLHARGGRNGCDSAIDGQAESQGLWSAMRHGDLKEFRRLAEEDGHSLLVRGPVGETLLHMCFVYQLPNLQECERGPAAPGPRRPRGLPRPGQPAARAARGPSRRGASKDCQHAWRCAGSLRPG